MEEVRMIVPGQFAWVEYDHGELRMIRVDHVYWCDEPDEEGWNVIYGDEEFYLESIRHIKNPIIAN